MWTYYPELLARPVPRYTSYPTAAEFQDTVGPAEMDQGLAGILPDTPASLYVHIPYCREICWYCGCSTGAANRVARLSAYLDRLEMEIALIASRLGGSEQMGRIAFGGGSPNAIAPAAFIRLVERIRTAFRCDAPVLSVEIDPRGFSPEWAAALSETGVSRVSLGVQTFDPHIQAAIGRIQPVDQIRRTVDLLRIAGVSSINFDLMYGLPGQTREILQETLRTSLSMVPDRFAIFGYAHVPHLIARQRRIEAQALPNPPTRFEQAALAHEMLASAGYDPVGFDHFALPEDDLAQAAATGRLRRNFQGFTEDQAELLIGLGASAISQFPDRLLQNEKNTGRYHLAIAAGRPATARGILRTTQDRIRGCAIEMLLTRGRADLSSVCPLEAIRAQLEPFAARGLLSWCGTELRLSPEALPYARSVAAVIDAYRTPNAVQFSSAI